MTKTRTLVEEFTQSDSGRRLFLQARAIRRITDLIETLMDEQGISRAQLATKLHKTPSWVTQLLDGEKNKTVRTIADVLAVLDRELDFKDREIRIGAAKAPGLRIIEHPWQEHCSQKLWPSVPHPTLRVEVV